MEVKTFIWRYIQKCHYSWACHKETMKPAVLQSKLPNQHLQDGLLQLDYTVAIYKSEVNPVALITAQKLQGVTYRNMCVGKAATTPWINLPLATGSVKLSLLPRRSVKTNLLFQLILHKYIT